jgi:hypothetical protein
MIRPQLEIENESTNNADITNLKLRMPILLPGLRTGD